jgi:hypothetical protein
MARLARLHYRNCVASDQHFSLGFHPGNIDRTGREWYFTRMKGTFTAFVGTRRFATGELADVALAIKAAVHGDSTVSALVFDDASGRVVDLDLRGTGDDIVRRLGDHPFQRPASADPERRGPGRPRLGVVAREVTLLPRHWQWLRTQPGGASVALRKLVEEARRTTGDSARIRHSQEAAYRFMSAMAGNEAGYEEATRALFAADRRRFEALIGSWPADIRAYAATLAEDTFARSPSPETPA